MAVDTSVALQAPMNEAHTSSTGAPTNAWANYYQRINDWLSSVSKTLAQIRKGVTDGSEAAAGDIGEYMSATSGIVSLANTVTANLATLNLTAGDWDVTGAVTFSASAGTHLSFGIGIGSTGDAVTQATFPTTAINQAMVTAVQRYNVTGTTAVTLQAQAAFSGTVSAAGLIRARRMR